MFISYHRTNSLRVDFHRRSPVPPSVCQVQVHGCESVWTLHSTPSPAPFLHGVTMTEWLWGCYGSKLDGLAMCCEKDSLWGRPWDSGPPLSTAGYTPSPYSPSFSDISQVLGTAMIFTFMVHMYPCQHTPTLNFHHQIHLPSTPTLNSAA